MNYEKELEKILKSNSELRQVFKEHPERKELYIQKMKDSENASTGCRGINPAFCKKCAFSHGEPPFADLPEKAYCEVYAHGTTNGKPPDVYYDGAECEFYMKG